MEKCKIKLFLISVFVCFLVTITFYKRYRYDFYRNYDEQKLLLYSEEAFYFSFYNDIIKANTYKEGLNLLINDTRSEYPDTINAIKRFNIYPEIILGTIWRVLNLKSFFITPFNFYSYAAILSQATSVSILFFFSVYIGKSYFSGIIFLMLFFSCFREKFIIRLSAFPLRENFASVYMWCNILLLYIILKEKQNSFFEYLCLFFSSFFFFIFWQFSAFASLTHIIALFIVELLGYKISKKLNYILITFFSSYILSIIVTFFPRYLLYTYFPFVLIAIIITNNLFYYLYEKRKVKSEENYENKLEHLNKDKYKDSIIDKEIRKRKNCRSDEEVKYVENNINEKSDTDNLIKERYNLLQKVKVMLRKGLTSLFIFFILRLLVIHQEKDDSHVLSLLKVRLNLANHNFDSMIYSLSSEFNPFAPFMFKMLKDSALYDYIVIFSIIVLLYNINYFVYIYKGGKKKLNYEILESQFIFFLIQLLFYLLLMTIISRLRVLGLPLLCIFGSLIGSPYILNGLYSLTKMNFTHSKSSKVLLPKIIIYTFCLFGCFYPFIKYFPKNEYLRILEYEPLNLYKNMDLINWLKKNIKENEPLMADIPTSSFLRLSTNFKLILHPQYEDISLRKRVQDFYMLSACLPFSDAKKFFYEKYKIRYFISNIYRCATSGGNINIFSISDKVDSNYARCHNKNSMRFCSRIMYDNKNYKTLFRNGKYSVIYFTPKIIEDNSPYEIFNQLKYSDMKYYEPWINECKRTDEKCGIHIAEVARYTLDLLGYHAISSTLYKYVEDNFLDTNIDIIYHLGEYYDYDLKDTKKANELYRRAIDLIIKDKDDLSSYITGQVPFVSLPRKIYIISSYIYFLAESKLNKNKKEIFLLYKNMNDFVEAVLFALDNGYYYEKLKSDVSNEQEHIVKRYLYEKDLDSLVEFLCQNSTYIYQIRNENPQYVHIYKNFWNLIKRISYLNKCVIQSFHIFEKRQINFLDYLKFFYVYR
ncbi:conserved Plasmodium membrane protein, unknown function [Plasmodium gallinaceum]|uniref:Uncharacterized protein n=1 Tax=Plasmodium gallinaceum TaxID=5849 RepID=A0A1J1GLU3_PLAGA|nr:conserved Plasmodium membrane protein, unknown function [Plasmodium gallinaceum]CRG93382.1 conserved Plasmodium membrane protein, unknown function [Plasmodium gallinaceum]